MTNDLEFDFRQE